MDIQYLIFLQDIRESLGDWSATVAKIISAIPVSPLSILIMGILFWCVNKRAGLFLMFTAGFGELLNNLVKNTFCVYRPWIFEPDLQPVHEALKKASSYSFPSGHTTMATAVYGGLAYFYRKKFPALIIPCVILILLVALSRNFLGVHTPQDVLFAMLEIFLVIVFAEKIFDAMDLNQNFSRTAFTAGVIFCILATLYLVLKPYPEDFHDGKIIVESSQAIIDSFDKVGAFTGFLLGAFLEHKFINFKLNVSRKIKIRRIIIGGIVCGAAMVLLFILKKSGIEILYEFGKGFLPFISVSFLAPYTFNRVEKIR
ncbi:MAG: phosphatase PAP2 family protein [Selenomonadaceae bacterium]|nr:phosphatase PAP2 family protein [Selenomonadaceae bacterium]